MEISDQTTCLDPNRVGFRKAVNLLDIEDGVGIEEGNVAFDLLPLAIGLSLADPSSPFRPCER